MLTIMNRLASAVVRPVCRRNMSSVRVWEKIPRQQVAKTPANYPKENPLYGISTVAVLAVFVGYYGLYRSLQFSCELADLMNPANSPLDPWKGYDEYLTRHPELSAKLKALSSSEAK